MPDRDNERECCWEDVPELLQEVDDQLRRVADGLEPFEDPEGNANALYRTGQPAVRAAAEALLRAAGLWEQRQKQVADRRKELLRLYRKYGAVGYSERLQGEMPGRANERECCWEDVPELLQEVDDQLRRVAEGLEPFEDPQGNAMALYRTGQPADRAAAEVVLREAGLWEERQKGVAREREGLLTDYRRKGAEGYVAQLQGDAEFSRAWCEEYWPELLRELDEQLRRVAEGLEPFEDPQGNAMALYRTGLPADRAAAEAVLREAGLWEERQKKVVQERKWQLEAYRHLGAEGYAAQLQGDAEGSRVCHEKYRPELLPELDEQLRRMAEGLEPFEDPEGNANALYRTGQRADRAAAGAMLRAAGLWEDRQSEVAHQRVSLVQTYRRLGAEGYVAQLQRSDEYGSRAWHAKHLPELVPELDVQLRRVAEGLEPFVDPEGNALYRTGRPADRAAAELQQAISAEEMLEHVDALEEQWRDKFHWRHLNRSAASKEVWRQRKERVEVWRQRQELLQGIRERRLDDYRRLGAEGYAARLQCDSDHDDHGVVAVLNGSREWHKQHAPELVPELDEQLRRVAEGLEPFEDPVGMVNTLYRTGQPADRAAAESLLRAEGLWHKRQRMVNDCRKKQILWYRRMGAEDYMAHLRESADTDGSRAYYMENYPELVPELDEQLRNMAEGLEPFKDAEGKAIALYRTGQPADHATADAILEAAGLLHGRQADLGAQRGLQLGHYRRMGAQGYAAFLQRGAGTDGSRAHSEQNYPELLQELDAQLRRIAEGLPPFPFEGGEDNT